MMPNAITAVALQLHDIALLLDIDGTILDLAATPGGVVVPSALRPTLTTLFERTGGAIAFVSGRRISDIDRIFAPLKLPAIGGHGAEFRLFVEDHPVPRPIPPLDLALKQKFAAVADMDPGIIVEDKDYSIALHYRLAPELANKVRQAAAAICAGVPDANLELLAGKSMIEIKQKGFNKALGVRELMSEPPFKGGRPLFLGDDVTDEDVFTIMPDFDGIAISVGQCVVPVNYTFDRPADVRAWLERISKSDALHLS